MTISRTLSRARDKRHGTRLWSAATIALAAGVSACTAQQAERVPSPAVAFPAPEPAPQAPAAQPQPPKPAPPKRAVLPAPPAAGNVPAASQGIGQVIGQVIGMSQDDLRNALGEPAERIDQGPGQAWIYRTPACTVEVVFFLDVTRNGYYALDRKISGPALLEHDSPAERACYAEIQNARYR